MRTFYEAKWTNGSLLACSQQTGIFTEKMNRFAAATLVLLVAMGTPIEAADYGVDCSWPIFSKDLNCGNLLGDRKLVYEQFMDGCRKYHGAKADRCDSTEDDRLEMSSRQPQSMVNYTSAGYNKIRAPQDVMDILYDFWEKNKGNMKEEAWSSGNIYVNNFHSPTYMVSVEDANMTGGGYSLKKKIWDLVKPTIEQWTGMELQQTSMYGIRTYTSGAILSPHVDRLPLVSSCIINVAQDVDEDWVLEVYDRHNRAVNITMEPGDLVLYESGSLIHGRPFPLKGRFYSSIFIHFEPTGRKFNDTTNDYLDELDDFYPPYLLPNSPELDNWAARNPNGWSKSKKSPSAPIQQFNSPEGHVAAATGDVERLHSIAKESRQLLQHKDTNGWQPIHEGARAGHLEAVKMLIQHGANHNARTGQNGRGSSPLNIAIDHLTVNHPVSQYLLQIGARNYKDEEL